MRGQLLSHVLAYGEMLFAWQLPDKRAELLKLAEDDIGDLSLDIALAYCGSDMPDVSASSW